VFGETYRIKFKKGMKCLGLTDAGDKTITMRSDMSPRELFATFIHELLHAMQFEHGIKIKHKSIYKYEKAIVDLLLDNFL
jgi:hypothetical protein